MTEVMPIFSSGLDFPANPNVGDQFQGWTWDGTKWIRTPVIPPAQLMVSVGPTPPGSPAEGFLWWDAVGGNLYIWYIDATSSQWVIANLGVMGPTGPQGPPGPAVPTVNIQPSVPTYTDLPTTDNNINDARITVDTGDLWIWDGATWFNAGQIQGPPGPTGATGPQGPAGPPFTPTTTGTGNTFVLQTGPTIITPSIISGASIVNGLTVDTISASGNITTAVSVQPGTGVWCGPVGASTGYIDGNGNIAGATLTTNGNASIGTHMQTNAGDGSAGGYGLITWMGNILVSRDDTNNPIMCLGNPLNTWQMGIWGNQPGWFVWQGGPGAPGGATRMTIDADGNCYNTTGTWSAISDPKLKRDVSNYKSGLSAILALQPINYHLNGQGHGVPNEAKTAPLHIGLDADAVNDVLPELVRTVDFVPGGYKAIDTGALVFALINAVKELNAKLEALK